MKKLFSIVVVIVAIAAFWIGTRRASNHTSVEPMLNTNAAIEHEIEGQMQEPNKIPGSSVKALCVAYDAFLKDPDLSPNHNKIENYTVSVREGNKTFEVYFEARLASGEKPHPGGSTQLGRDVTYAISKQGFQVTKRTFYK